MENVPLSAFVGVQILFGKLEGIRVIRYEVGVRMSCMSMMSIYIPIYIVHINVGSRGRLCWTY